MWFFPVIIQVFTGNENLTGNNWKLNSDLPLRNNTKKPSPFTLKNNLYSQRGGSGNQKKGQKVFNKFL